MILRALPHTPGHDGVRLFLPAFGVLALLGGLGAHGSLLDRFGRWAKAAIVAALVEGIVSVAVMMPVPLSYFSPIVGGLPGATALGMEPTYYWDALSPEARRWLAEHTPPGRTILFATIPPLVALPPPDRRPAAPALSRSIRRSRPAMVRPSEPPGGLLGRRPALVAQGRAEFTSSRSWASRWSGSSRTSNGSNSHRVDGDSDVASSTNGSERWTQPSPTDSGRQTQPPIGARSFQAQGIGVGPIGVVALASHPIGPNRPWGIGSPRTVML